MFMFWILIGVAIGLVLACRIGPICDVVDGAWKWLMGAIRGRNETQQ